MVCEFKVKIKTEDATYNKKFLLHDEIAFSVDDPKVTECINQALSEVKGAPEDVIISAKMQV